MDDLSREERIREKLKFFNLESESLNESRIKIQKKVTISSSRFGPRTSNMAIRKEEPGQKTYFNPFEEMMAIEAEFGSIFQS